MVRFGNVVFDEARRTVVRDGEPQHLEPQAFDLLAYLLRHRDRVVAKEELLDEVWGDQFVGESALTTRVKEVRRAVGDDGTRQAVVKNFRGRGYRFTADVSEIVTDDAGVDPPAPLPASGRSLLGRTDDMDRLVERLETATLITLVGPGGVGKTTLATEIADERRRRGGDTIHIVRLASVGEAGDVVHALQLGVGLTEAASEGELVSAVADLDALVVLDNCEHVIGEVARLVRSITGRGGQVRLLATSRERLAVGGEQVWPVGPLDPESAAELLVARARTLDPAFELEDDDEPSVRRLLTMLDHLPLAIEMAASRLPSTGLDDLLDRLGGRLDLLRSPERDTDVRHRTLAGVVEWSLPLLEPATRDLLVAMTVFAGPVAADDVAAVVGDDADSLALGALADLVDQSMVVADASQRPTRYGLFETVRAVIAPMRTSGVDERHAEHVAEVVEAADEELRTPYEPRAAARIDGLLAEIRHAHRWARRIRPDLADRLTAALLSYSSERQWREPAQWCADWAAERDVDGLDLSAPCAAVMAADASNRGDYTRARRLAELASTSDDRRVAGSAMDTIANVGLYDGHVDEAVEWGTRLAELGQRTGDTALWTLGLAGRVLAAVYRQDHEAARRWFDDAVPPGPLSPTSLAWWSYSEAEIDAAAGDVDRAIERFARAVELGTSVGSSFVVSVSEISRLAALARSGEIEQGIEENRAVLERHRRTESPTHAITALRIIVGLLARAERFEPAMEVLGAVLGDDVKSTYGTESEQLDRARADAEAAAGAEVVAAWIDVGRSRDLTWAIERALAALDV